MESDNVKDLNVTNLKSTLATSSIKLKRVLENWILIWGARVVEQQLGERNTREDMWCSNSQGIY